MPSFNLAVVLPPEKSPLGGLVSPLLEALHKHLPGTTFVPLEGVKKTDLDLYSHLLCIGTSVDLAPTGDILAAHKGAKPLSYAYLFSDTPFVDPVHTQVIGSFDFLVTPSEHVNAAYKLAALDNKPSLATFRTCQNTKVIPIGMDIPSILGKEIVTPPPAREELRTLLFGDSVQNDDFLILVRSSERQHTGIPTALETLVHLKKKLPKAKMVIQVEGPFDLETYCAGIGLTYGKDVFEERRNHTADHLKYFNRTFDLVYFPVSNVYSYAAALPYMATMVPVAVPDDHAWTDLLTEDAAIAIPASGFSKAPWNPDTFYRPINAYEAADVIFAAKQKGLLPLIDRAFKLLETKQLDLLGWRNKWLKLFGLI